jgi:hypothetical protein
MLCLAQTRTLMTTTTTTQQQTMQIILMIMLLITITMMLVMHTTCLTMATINGTAADDVKGTDANDDVDGDDKADLPNVPAKKRELTFLDIAEPSYPYVLKKKKKKKNEKKKKKKKIFLNCLHASTNTVDWIHLENCCCLMCPAKCRLNLSHIQAVVIRLTHRAPTLSCAGACGGRRLTRKQCSTRALARRINGLDDWQRDSGWQALGCHRRLVLSVRSSRSARLHAARGARATHSPPRCCSAHCWRCGAGACRTCSDGPSYRAEEVGDQDFHRPPGS